MKGTQWGTGVRGMATWYGSQSPTRPPVSLTSWYSCFCVVPSYSESGLALCDQQNIAKMTVCDFWSYIITALQLLLWSLGLLTLGEPTAMCWGHSMGDLCGKELRSLDRGQDQFSSYVSEPIWKCIKMQPHERPLASTTWLSHFQIPDTHKLLKIINHYCFCLSNKVLF